MSTLAHDITAILDEHSSHPNGGCDATIEIRLRLDAEPSVVALDEFVVAECLKSRKQGSGERQAAYLRDVLLTRFDPLMLITERLSRPAAHDGDTK